MSEFGFNIRTQGQYSSNPLKLFRVRDDSVFLIKLRAITQPGADPEDHMAVYDASRRTLIDNTVDPLIVTDADCVNKDKAIGVLLDWFEPATSVQLLTVYLIDAGEVPLSLRDKTRRVLS